MAITKPIKDRITTLKSEYDYLRKGRESLLTMIDEVEVPESVYNSNAEELKELEKNSDLGQEKKELRQMFLDLANLTDHNLKNIKTDYFEKIPQLFSEYFYSDHEISHKLDKLSRNRR